MMTKSLPGVCLLAAVALAGCGQSPAAPEPPRPAIVRAVAPEAAHDQVRYAGIVHSRHESTLGFRENGKLTAREVELGDRVSQGQLLARLDARDLSLAAQAATASLVAARERHAQAERQYRRMASLYAQGMVSRATRDQHKTALDVAGADLDGARKQAAVAANRLGYTRLRADHDGIITAVDADAGQVVAAGQPVVTLAWGGQRELWVSVPESRVATVRVGAPVTVELPAVPGARLSGQVREVAASADPVSGTYRVRISLPEAPEGLRLGMSGSAWLRAPGGAKVVRLPLTSLYHQGQQPAVWVVDAHTDKVVLQPVQVVRYTDTSVILAAEPELAAGSQVVIKGVAKLHAGQRVRPVAGLADVVRADPDAPQ